MDAAASLGPSPEEQARLDSGWKPRPGPRAYLIRCTVTGRLKIGRTVNPRKRFRVLWFMSPTPLELLATVDDPRGRRERELHRRFTELRLHGEWFKPAAEIFAAFGVQVPA